MADLLALSARYIDNDLYEGAGLVNRPTMELSELGNDIALIEAFSHVATFKTGDGLVLFDTSLEAFGGGVLASMRRWTDEPVRSEEHTSELQSLMRISYDGYCLNKKKNAQR